MMNVLPFDRRISNVDCPPRPDALGSHTDSVQAAATAASTALPPAFRVASAASVARGKAVAAAPPVGDAVCPSFGPTAYLI